jgi:hypothetical protein
VGILALVQCPFYLYRCFAQYRDPFPVWAVPSRWYDELILAVVSAILAVACIVYDYKQTHAEQSDQMRPMQRRRWRRMRAARFALYFAATLLILELPLIVLRFGHTFGAVNWWLLNEMMFVMPEKLFYMPAIGIGLIVYDRRRIKRELREDRGQCVKCGYDLRWSKDRCPECGAFIKRKGSTLDEIFSRL